MRHWWADADGCVFNEVVYLSKEDRLALSSEFHRGRSGKHHFVLMRNFFVWTARVGGRVVDLEFFNFKNEVIPHLGESDFIPETKARFSIEGTEIQNADLLAVLQWCADHLDDFPEPER